MREQKFKIQCPNPGCNKILGTSSKPVTSGYACTECKVKNELEEAMKIGKVVNHTVLSDDELKTIVDKVNKSNPEMLKFNYGDRIDIHIKKLKESE